MATIWRSVPRVAPRCSLVLPDHTQHPGMERDQGNPRNDPSNPASRCTSPVQDTRGSLDMVNGPFSNVVLPVALEFHVPETITQVVPRSFGRVCDPSSYARVCLEDRVLLPEPFLGFA